MAKVCSFLLNEGIRPRSRPQHQNIWYNLKGLVISHVCMNYESLILKESNVSKGTVKVKGFLVGQGQDVTFSIHVY